MKVTFSGWEALQEMLLYRLVHVINRLTELVFISVAGRLLLANFKFDDCHY